MARVKVAIGKPEGAGIDKVRLQYRRTDLYDWVKVGDYAGDVVTVPDMKAGVSYEFAALAMSANGATQPLNHAAKQTIRLAEKATTPSGCTGFGCAQNGAYVDFRWTPQDTARDDITYEIRRGIAWSGSALVGTGIRGDSYRWPWEFSGSTLTFHIKARDKYGNWSGSQDCQQAISPLENYVTGTSNDDGGGAFGDGTLSNTSVNGNALELSTVANAADDLTGVTADTLAGVTAFHLYYGSGTYTTAVVDLGSDRDVRLEVEVGGTLATDVTDGMVADDFAGTPVTKPDRDDDPASPRPTQGYPADGDDRALAVDVDIRTSSNNSDWTEYGRWVPGDIHERYYQLRLTLRSRFGRDYPSLSSFQHWERKKNRKQELRLSLGTPATGTFWTFDKAFYDVPTVTAVVEGQAVTGDYLKIGTPTTTGVTVWAYDTNGDLADRNVALIAAGT